MANLAGAPASVLGVPLHPGERVTYFNRPDFSTAKTMMLVMGILLAVVLFGILLLVKRSQIDRNNPRALVVTNYRILVFQGTGEVTEVPLRDLADVRAIRHASSMLADRRPKTEDGYWRGGTAIGVDLVDGRGGSTSVRCGDRPDAIWSFGRFLATGLATRSFDRLPPVQAPA